MKHFSYIICLEQDPHLYLDLIVQLQTWERISLKKEKVHVCRVILRIQYKQYPYIDHATPLNKHTTFPPQSYTE